MFKLILFLSFYLISDVKEIVINEPIKLGGYHLFSVRGMDASKRSDIIYNRLRYLLTPNLKKSDITVSSVKGQAVVLVNDEILVTITNEDAVLNKTPKYILAKKVQENLSKILPELVPLDRN